MLSLRSPSARTRLSSFCVNPNSCPRTLAPASVPVQTLGQSGAPRRRRAVPTSFTTRFVGVPQDDTLGLLRVRPFFGGPFFFNSPCRRFLFCYVVDILPCGLTRLRMDVVACALPCEEEQRLTPKFTVTTSH